ncbi:MAG: hypothetical protein QG595_287 [Pseudomonadota bacterium]|jgi:hypothetical protein|nr:hypothetical protein [Pseudomonadota bacterium]
MPCIRIRPDARLVAGSRGSRNQTLVLMLLASLLLTGCVVRIAYGQLEWLTRWSVESYLDLSNSQEHLVREIIGRNLAWHRATELPQYAAYLRELRAGVAAPVSAEFIAQQYATTLVIWDRTLQQIAPDIARLLMTLDDEQVSEFFDEIEERNAELAEEYSGQAPEIRRKKQDRSIIRAFRWFVGPLSPAQEVVVKAHTAGMHDLTEQWLQRRKAWQSAFRELLEARSGNAAFERQLTELLLDPNQFDSAEYRRLVAANREIAFAMSADVLSSLSPKQRKHLDERLSGLARDFDELAMAPAR